ncbi:stage II sporulation protein M [Clostridium tarantellae]|uniref:Stage II sporulation protein M n=1 Tax=Clostridium tarantellae TaxID=39493 RepID=A0A6I1MH91_9CLOT|nr:stage II sporulation protein M [Clostridium tarantellae]MPQ42745.1 stage II sporulation protein M [Clostridium tarantellae]
MKRILQQIKEAMQDNKVTFLWILLFFLIGLVLGSYTVYYMSDFNKIEISNYFNNFLEHIKTSPISYTQILLNSVTNIIPMVILIILLGYTMIGAPIILIIDMIKGYVIGFTFSLLVTLLGTKGVLILFLGIIIQNLIFIPCIIIISILAVKNSTIKFKGDILKEGVRNSKINKLYINIQAILSLILVAGIIIETYISPNLIKLVITG